MKAKIRGGSPGNHDRKTSKVVTASESKSVTAHEIFNIIGALAMQIVLNIINLLALPSEMRDAVIGILIIITVLFDNIVRRQINKRKAAV